MAVTVRAIILKSPVVSDEETARASFPDDCVEEGNRFRSPRRYLSHVEMSSPE